MEINKIHLIDVMKGLSQLEDNSIDCIITSPPYNKGGKKKGAKAIWNNKIEYDSYEDDMPEEAYQKWQIKFLNECFRVLKPNGSMFYNHKQRRNDNKIILPEEWIFETNFYLTEKIYWNRKISPNVSPYFLTPTTEYFYWLTKNETDFNSYLDNLPKEYQTNIWTLSPERNLEHPAPFHKKLPELCLLLTTKKGDIVFDPFMGSGSTAFSAKKNERKYLGFDISQNYINITNRKLGELDEL